MTLFISRIILTAIIVLMAYFALQRVWTKKVDLLAFLKKPSEAIPVEEQDNRNITTNGLSDSPEQYKIFNPARSQAGLSKPQSIPPNQRVQIEFDEEAFDTLNEFDRNSHRWSAQKPHYINLI